MKINIESQKRTLDLKESLDPTVQGIIEDSVKMAYEVGHFGEDVLDYVYEDLDEEGLEYDKEEVRDYFYEYYESREFLEEGSPLTNDLPPSIDEFLMDLAQMWGMFDYSDIMKHKYSKSDINKLRYLRKKYIELGEVANDEDCPAAVDTVTKVADIVMSESLTENAEGTDSSLIELLAKLKTEATEAEYKYKELGNLKECRDILYYLVRDAQSVLDQINQNFVGEKSRSLGEATCLVDKVTHIWSYTGRAYNDDNDKLIKEYNCHIIKGSDGQTKGSAVSLLLREIEREYPAIKNIRLTDEPDKIEGKGRMQVKYPACDSCGHILSDSGTCPQCYDK